MQIIHTPTKSEPKDGKVEVFLGILARDEKGNPLAIPQVTGWVVAGVMQEADGKLVTANSLTVHLPQGEHTVKVFGHAPGDRSFEAQATVVVNIAVKQESNVRINNQTPAPAPQNP